jgi:hypothetical protein
MKKLITSFLIVLSTSTYAGETLKDNFCVPRVDSKRYIMNDFHASYPKTVKFECTYECQANGKVELVTGPSTVSVTSMDSDARDVVCQGVKVKKVSWGYDFDGIEAFYAYTTSIKQIKAFAFANVNRNNKYEKELLQELQMNLNKVIAAYIITGVPHFVEAALILDGIAKELPASTKSLDKYMDILIKQNGKVAFEANALSLVLMNVNSNAAWRVPTHLFK